MDDRTHRNTTPGRWISPQAKDTHVNTTSRGTYHTPEIVEVGSVSQLTQGERSGNFLDDTFPNDTPAGDVTFS
jgi:hypothetical protein